MKWYNLKSEVLNLFNKDIDGDKLVDSDRYLFVII